MKKDKINNGLSNGVMKTMLMNHLTGRAKTANKLYLDMYFRSLNESKKLLNEALILFTNKAYERSYFLGFSALEEISKSQIAADVYTGFITEDEFKKIYRDHKEKILRVKWIQLDGNVFPCFNYDGVKIKDFDFKKKLKSMYVDVDFVRGEISSPSICISKEDAKSILKAVEVGLQSIFMVTEINGEQIGTKGFMK
ncbi:MAG: AbiV family abortive infection protein [Candidatus Buchananbacteria bacterium]|jgi:AbiV family abortive infection protein